MKKRLRYIIVAFAISFIVVSVLSFYSIKQLVSLIDFSNQVDNTNKVIVRLISIERHLGDLDAQEKEFLITHDSNYINTYFVKYRLVNDEIQDLEKLIFDNTDQQKTVIMLRTTLALRINNFKKSIGYYSINGYTTELYNEGRSLRDESFSHIDKMMSKEKALLKQRFKDKRYFQNLTSSTFSYLLVIFFLLTILLFMLMIFELRKRMTYQNELQQNLVDLQNSHAELEQIAFATSHTFKEYLRKIRIFGDRLLWLQKDKASEETKSTIQKIDNAASKLQEFSDELSNLTRLVGAHNYSQKVNLNLILNDITDEYTEQIQTYKIRVNISPLPQLTGNQAQLSMLFKQLIDNAIKFRSTNIQPVVIISYQKTTGSELEGLDKTYKDKSFHKIVVSDNGIGFDEVAANNILKAFQKLHDSQLYPGKGFGLAIVKRIMTNHHGFIIARSPQQKGSEFTLYFPEE